MSIELGSTLRVQVSLGMEGGVWVELEAREYPDGHSWSLLDAREIKLTDLLDHTEWLQETPENVSDAEKIEAYKAIADAALQLAYTARTRMHKLERTEEATHVG